MSHVHIPAALALAVSLLAGLAVSRAEARQLDFVGGKSIAIRNGVQQLRDTIGPGRGSGAGYSAAVKRSALPMKSHPLRSPVRKALFGFEPTGQDNNPLVKAVQAEAESESFRDFQRLYDTERRGVFAVVKALKKTVPGSRVEDRDEYAVGVRSPSGEKYQVHVDPNVVEAGTPPAQLRDVKQTLGKVFVAFRRAGVTPKPGTQGGGHIHVDKTLFMKDPLLLRNLLVDSYNFGILKLVMRPFDMTSANSMWNRGEGDKFREAIRQIDRAAMKAGRYEWKSVLAAMKPFYMSDTRKRDINLENLYDPGPSDPPTVEFRAFEAQTSSREGYLQAKLLRRYLEGLAAVGKPVPVANQRSIDSWYKSVDAKGTFNYSLVEKKWKGFIQQLGLDYRDYKPFLEQWNLKASSAQQKQPDPRESIRAFFERQMR